MTSAGEIPRHSAYTRFVHWAVAICFFLALFSGFVDFFAKGMAWLAPVFGGRKSAAHLHPWFSLAFVAFFVLQFANWLARMKWRPPDSRFVQKAVANPLRPGAYIDPETGFFNGGQKLFFWLV